MRTAFEVRHEQVQGDGVKLHVAVAGEGPPVILLHGFPENWTSWRHQIRPLVEAGFKVIAPDLRGYNRSERPAGREAYHLRYLVGDVVALVRWTGEPRAHVAGHDWGGIVAWTFAGTYPERLDRLVILNAPHLELYLEKVRKPPQLFQSWYVLFFQLPGVSERALAARDFAAVRRMFSHIPARPGAFTEEDIDGYVEALARPGALTAALNYYRALRHLDAVALGRSARTNAETLVIWGEQDLALSIGLLDGLERFAPKVQVHRIPEAGHWIQNEAPEEVSKALIRFLQG